RGVERSRSLVEEVRRLRSRAKGIAEEPVHRIRPEDRVAVRMADGSSQPGAHSRDDLGRRETTQGRVLGPRLELRASQREDGEEKRHGIVEAGTGRAGGTVQQ